MVVEVVVFVGVISDEWVMSFYVCDVVLLGGMGMFVFIIMDNGFDYIKFIIFGV